MASIKIADWAPMRGPAGQFSRALDSTGISLRASASSWKLFPEAGAAAADKGMEKTSAGHKKKKVRKSINLCFVLWCIAIYFTLYFLFKLKIV